MKRISVILLAVLAIATIGTLTYVRAQNPDITPNQMTVAGAHSLCTTATGQTRFCFAADGLYISINGAAYAQVVTGTQTAGVTSLNGKTGALTLTATTVSTTTSTTTPSVN